MDKFLNIGKIRGVLLSAIIISVYYLLWLPYLHREYFGFDAEKGWGTRMILTGLILTQIVVIQAGDRARLTFAGGILDRLWGNGVCCMPNILHFTISLFNFAVLWGLAVLKDNTYKRYVEPTVHVDMSDARMQYRANVTMSYGQAQVSRAIETLLKKLFFDWRRVPEEYYVASFGYRVLIIGILIVCWNSSIVNLKARTLQYTQSIQQDLSKLSPPVVQHAKPATQQNQQKEPPSTRTLVAPPPSPQPKKPDVFLYVDEAAPNLHEDTLNRVALHPWGTVLGADQFSRKYYAFGPKPEKVPSMEMVSTGSFCGVIPKGGVARVVVSERPMYLWNTNEYALISFVPGKPMRQPSQYDTSEMYWEVAVPWRDLVRNWFQYKEKYQVKANVQEQIPKTVMMVGVIAAEHSDHQTAAFCFGR